MAEDVGVSLLALKNIPLTLQMPNDQEIADLTVDKFRTAALQNRADILGALAEYAAAQSSLQLEIAKQYPDIHLQPGYQFDQGDNKWSLGLLVELPILNQNQGPIAEAKARREESAAKFIALQARVLAEIDRAAEALRITQRTVGMLRALAGAQAQRRDAMAAQFKAGAIDQLELLNAESELVAAQLVQLDGQMRFQQAIGTMEDALQLKLNLPSVIFESSRSGEH
jgi:outer membrane protein TolC